MKIKLYNNAAQRYTQLQIVRKQPINREWVAMLEQIQGTELIVETEFMFANQFNTAPDPAYSENGLRVQQHLVEYVIDDERPGKARCQWCGGTSANTNQCTHCGNTDHLFVFKTRCDPGGVVWTNK